MIASVNSLLNFDKGCINCKEFFVVGQNRSNGSFIIHHILASSLKEKKNVCLLSFVQKFHHYNSVSQKIGVCLQTMIDRKQFVFLDGLEMLQTFYSEETSGKLILSKFRNIIFKAWANFKETKLNDIILVIDDVTVLLSMGIHQDEIGVLVSSIVSDLVAAEHTASMNDKHTSTIDQGTSLVISCSYTEQDKESINLWRFLTHLSSLEVDVTGLLTGYCKDVHGEISITWKDKLLSPRCHQKKKLQFRLLDSGVEFFAVGMSAAVL